MDELEDKNIKLNYMEVAQGRVTMCAWCGNSKSKKVRGTGADGRPIQVCQEHFRGVDGALVNEATALAIARTWETKIEQSNRSRT